VINHAIRHLLGERKNIAITSLGWLLTFIAVVFSWVFFRASSIEIALGILQAMTVGTFSGSSSDSLLGINRIMDINECLVWVAGCGVIAFFVPNAYEILGKGLLHTHEKKLNGGLGGVAFGVALVTIFILLSISETRGVSEFLYFNF
jgi:hypothetical protein